MEVKGSLVFFFLLRRRTTTPNKKSSRQGIREQTQGQVIHL